MKRILPLLLALCLSGGAVRGAQMSQVNTMKPVFDVMQTVSENYAGDKKYTQDDMVNAALTGITGGLDRYSEFLDQQAFKDMKDETKGQFGGVGIELGFMGSKLSVIAPIEGTPADKAGLRGGDHIARVDGTSTDGMKIIDAVHRIKGPPGTKVVLTILREGFSPRDYTLLRAIITPVNVRWRVMDNGIGYATIRSFSEKTAENLAVALDEFRKKKVTGVILDLRSNPGGLLAEAVRVVDLFLPGGKLIVSTEGRDPRQSARYFSNPKLSPATFPLVVLTNDHSASASEIVSGALKDWGRAVIAGRRTFGKASVQSIQPITRDESKAMRLTIAHYYTPKHKEIHEVGIEADFNIPTPRLPALLRKFGDLSQFNAFAASLFTSGTQWMDPAALREGKLAPTPKGESADEFDLHLGAEFRKWAQGTGTTIDDGDWEEGKEMAIQQVRMAVMRRVKGEEAARKMSIEFDPQVKSASALLKLATASKAGSR